MKKIIIVLLTILLTASIVAQEKEIPQERAFQFSFITPLGTNGMDSHLYTNTVSLNVLGGYSYANTIFEMGSLYNINFGYTSGAQAAGLFNYTGEAKNVVQFAGLFNLSLAGNTPIQFAGLGNVTESVKGVQGSGLLNISETITGAQLAGLINLNEETMGVQGAGAMNVAGSVKGIQMSGAVNLADNLIGFQGSSILNVAASVKGVQMGLINYATEIEGVQIGLINVVEKGGKQELEISSSEVLNALVSFKLGTDTLYTIFSSGAYFLNYDFEYAAGVGLGTQLNWNNGWSNQIEGIYYSFSRDAELNSIFHSISQIKLLTSKTLVGRLTIFAGPTVNLEIRNKDNSTGEFTSSLAPWSMWNHKGSSTHLNMWVGVNAGLSYRF